MKIQTIAVALLSIALASPAFARSGSTVHVRPHVTKSGSYVAPHVRTAPDHSKYNNWSTKGNVNPYTGKKGTKTPSVGKKGK